MTSENKFDQVMFHDPIGGAKTMTPEEFRAIPIAKRVDWLCKGWFKFYREGNPVPAIEALKVMKPGEVGK